MNNSITITVIKVSSPAFKNNDYIPAKYTCEGAGVNPAISLSGMPAQTKSIALIMDDPDAPNGTFDHWLLWDIDPGINTINEDSAPGIQGKNGRSTNKYTGPCPPSGTHHYHFKVYALNRKIGLQEGADKKALEAAMKGYIIAEGEMVGLYKKTGKNN